ncbi:Programmed cell death 1 ligand 1 [Channa argus]|uniref:Programmed cell death 1 ligand 1 n=1 Tax=Channa argus TaxID=215402 RepID=A0A6G1Q6Y1_CHAAH|nr:Programmed cell death 1 ligand 1 [Channa argus]
MRESRRIFLLCLLTFWGICSASEDQQQITVKTGDDVTLQCWGPSRDVIELLEWNKPDLKSQDYVYYFRDERLYKNYQHPSFHGRAELRDSQMKDGDVSVILRNSSVNDTGKYDCYVGYGGRSELITTITLKVTDSGAGTRHTKNGGDNDGHVGLIAGLSVAGLLVVIAVAVGLVIFRKHNSSICQSPAEL